jgi:hypothetical protein
MGERGDLMRQYFSNIPSINYNGVNLRDLMLKAVIAREVLDTGVVFYPYTLRDGDTPQSIAYDYYGSVEYDWLVMFSNQMVDQVYQWYMSTSDFDSYIEAYYGTIANAMATTHHYESVSGGLQYTPTSYQYNTTGLDSTTGLPLYAVDCYTWETQQNEAKRNINLINKAYASAIALELEKKLAP